MGSTAPTWSFTYFQPAACSCDKTFLCWCRKRHESLLYVETSRTSTVRRNMCNVIRFIIRFIFSINSQMPHTTMSLIPVRCEERKKGSNRRVLVCSNYSLSNICRFKINLYKVAKMYILNSLKKMSLNLWNIWQDWVQLISFLKCITINCCNKVSFHP